ncbi:hypothetical protein ABW19_dt0205750 [Dactylella cylindrospora]|nr:hypothetical protein ABW19_dt0205750 [Dactylella cylindrospora]
MAENFHWGTTGDEVVSEFADLVKGKTVLITGVATNGLGGETAIALSKAQPKLLILHARSEEKIAPIAKTVQEAGVPTRSVVMDLSSLASVRKGAETVASWDDVTVDVLINNAGVMTTPYGKTADGFEQQFGINHLSHFLLTNLLLKAGKISNGGRIVNVTSLGHRRSGIRWDDIGFQDGAVYDKLAAYGQSKAANVLFSIALADKLKAQGITAYSCHPGSIGTNLGRHLEESEIADIVAAAEKLGEGKYNVAYKTLNQGVSTQIVAAFSPLLLDQNGAYCVDCQPREPAAHASGLDNANRLWTVSEEMVGEKFSY